MRVKQRMPKVRAKRLLNVVPFQKPSPTAYVQWPEAVTTPNPPLTYTPDASETITDSFLKRVTVKDSGPVVATNEELEARNWMKNLLSCIDAQSVAEQALAC